MGSQSKNMLQAPAMIASIETYFMTPPTPFFTTRALIAKGLVSRHFEV